MKNSFLKMLKCPLCGSGFEISKEISRLNKNMEWGVICCLGCKTKYPVAFGIPILKHPDAYADVVNDYNQKNYSVNKDSLVKKLVVNIEEGKIEEVIRALLFTHSPRKLLKRAQNNEKSFNYDTKLTRVLPNFVVRLLGKRRLYYLYWIITKLTFQDLRSRKKKEKIFKRLMQQTTAAGFIEHYFQLVKSAEMERYFLYRYGTPRHLTSLSLLSTIPESESPILEVACGAGHIMQYFTERKLNCPVIGMDRTFAHLYLAKKYICPEGNYFCAGAEQKLPFQANLFSAVYCSDAFPELPSREHVVSEMKRVLIDDGTIIITRVSSIPQSYYNSDAILSAMQLKKLFSDMTNIVLDEDDILDRYISKLGPDLKNEHTIEDLNQKDWISIVASHCKNTFNTYGQFHFWPHANGHLNINPLFSENGKDIYGNIILNFEFPSTWYVNTNIEYMKYAIKSVHLSQSTLNEIKEGKRTPEVEELISKFVVLGMSENFF